jgi:MFS family permease
MSSLTTSSATQEGRTSADRRWLVLVVVAVAQLMLVLDATIVNIALPSAQQALGFSNSDRQWVVTAYALAFGSLLLVGGRLGDMFSRKCRRDRRGRRPGLHPWRTVGQPAANGLARRRAGLRRAVRDRFGFSQAETAGWTAALTLGSLVAGVVLLVGFVVAERRVPHPLAQVINTATSGVAGEDSGVPDRRLSRCHCRWELHSG